MKAILLLLLLILFPVSSATSADPGKPKNLARLDAWSDTGKWATAGRIEASTHKEKWKSIESGDSILYNGEKGKTVDLVSRAKFGDVEVEAEFMIPKSSNSGIYLMYRYEVQIFDSYGKADGELAYDDNGGIYQRWDDSRGETKAEKGYEGTAPATNASSAPGKWQKLDIVFRAPRFDEEGSKTENARFVRVELNGVVIHEDVEVTGFTRAGKSGPEVRRAPLMIQGTHGPIAFRELRVRPVELP